MSLIQSAKLNGHDPYLSSFFGSVLRGQDTDMSDLDILITLKPQTQLFGFGESTRIWQATGSVSRGRGGRRKMHDALNVKAAHGILTTQCRHY